jgi:SH3-like domain-containing protein
MTRRKYRRRLVAATLAIALGLPLSARLDAIAEQPAVKQAEASAGIGTGFRKGRITGFPVPRFVSLKSQNAHMRVGPSTDYPTAWVYSARGLPLEITDEFGNWRRVRDQDGASGWMFAPLLSGRRTAVVGPWRDKPVALHTAPRSSAGVIARLDPAVRLNLDHCDGTWCRVVLQSRSLSGFVAQGDLWGVYPHERLD